MDQMDPDLEELGVVLRKVLKQVETTAEMIKSRRARWEKDRMKLEGKRERLLYQALRFIADQPCQTPIYYHDEYPSEGITECAETDKCVTEFCLPCYARVHLEQHRRMVLQEDEDDEGDPVCDHPRKVFCVHCEREICPDCGKGYCEGGC